MPIYEFTCHQCHRRTTVFVRSFSQTINTTCPSCGRGELSRLISPFSVLRPLEAEGGELEADLEGRDEEDPRDMSSLMRHISEKTGEPLTPELEEMVERMESGQIPKEWAGDFGDESAEEE